MPNWPKEYGSRKIDVYAPNEKLAALHQKVEMFCFVVLNLTVEGERWFISYF